MSTNESLPRKSRRRNSPGEDEHTRKIMRRVAVGLVARVFGGDDDNPDDELERRIAAELERRIAAELTRPDVVNAYRDVDPSECAAEGAAGAFVEDGSRAVETVARLSWAARSLRAIANGGDEAARATAARRVRALLPTPASLPDMLGLVRDAIYLLDWIVLAFSTGLEESRKALRRAAAAAAREPEAEKLAAALSVVAHAVRELRAGRPTANDLATWGESPMSCLDYWAGDLVLELGLLHDRKFAQLTPASVADLLERARRDEVNAAYVTAALAIEARAFGITSSTTLDDVAKVANRFRMAAKRA